MTPWTRWLALGCAAFFLSASVTVAAEPQKAGIVFERIGLKKLRLDLYYPSSPPPARGYPLLIWIHGGGWFFGNRSSDVITTDFTARGFAVASLDYRSSLGAKFPAQIEDVTAGTQWLLRNARELQLDADRIGLAGASAGGHLALLLGLSQKETGLPWSPRTTNGKRIRAIAALYPPTDLIQVVRPENRDRKNNLVALLLGAPVNQRRELAAAGSPLRYVRADSPPVFLVHGALDELVPLEQSLLLRRALRAQGVPCTLVLYPESGHGFRPTAETRTQMARFFEKALRPRD